MVICPDGKSAETAARSPLSGLSLIGRFAQSLGKPGSRRTPSIDLCHPGKNDLDFECTRAATDSRNQACSPPSSAMINRDDHGQSPLPLGRCGPRRISMDTTPTISVTLSPDLLNHLRQRARSERVPLSWLVAALVCDTVAAWKERPGGARGVPVPELGGLPISPTWN